MIYLDHAATSYPKPPAVLAAMRDYMETAGNPGRSSHAMAQRAEELVWDARQSIADLLGADEPDRVVFTLNATMALNMAIKGTVAPGDRVLTSSFEHNSVVRPLHAAGADKVTWTPVPPGPDSPVNLEVLESELARGGVRAVCVAHASNITGAVAPVREIYALARRHGAILVLDAAQSAGHLPVDISMADVLIFAGHKGLFGPQGTGGMYVGAGVTIRPSLHGGTGGRSELPIQPRWLPHALEAGTPNGVGIAGLAAASRYVSDIGVDQIRSAETLLRQRLLDRLRAVDGVVVHECPTAEPATVVVSISLADGRPVGLVAALLDERYGVQVRAGLHCAPLAHATIGTLPGGTVRFSVAHLTTPSDLDAAVAALAELVTGDRTRPLPPERVQRATKGVGAP